MIRYTYIVTIGEIEVFASKIIFSRFSIILREGFIKNHVRNFGFHTRPSKNQTKNPCVPSRSFNMDFWLGESKKKFLQHIHLMVLEGFFHFKLLPKLSQGGRSIKFGQKPKFLILFFMNPSLRH